MPAPARGDEGRGAVGALLLAARPGLQEGAHDGGVAAAACDVQGSAPCEDAWKEPIIRGCCRSSRTLGGGEGAGPGEARGRGRTGSQAGGGAPGSAGVSPATSGGVRVRARQQQGGGDLAAAADAGEVEGGRARLCIPRKTGHGTQARMKVRADAWDWRRL